MSGSERSERMRRRMMNPWAFRAYLAGKLPLALVAGLRLRRLDEAACTVSLPGGWRTRNPFASTYFAAHLMAAEMATGAPAMVLVAGAPASVALILREVRAVFTRRLQGEGLFTFDDVGGMRAAVERAAAGTESESYTGRPLGRAADGTVVSEFEIIWSFKRRG